MGNDAISGSVSANRSHHQQAASALAGADTSWMECLISRRGPLAGWPDALNRQPNDVKVVVDLIR